MGYCSYKDTVVNVDTVILEDTVVEKGIVSLQQEHEAVES